MVNTHTITDRGFLNPLFIELVLELDFLGAVEQIEFAR
jgi:hypothetical protein